MYIKMEVTFEHLRTLEEFKRMHNISKLFLHKSVRKVTDESGNSVLQLQKYEDGTTKRFMCDPTGKIFLAVAKAICEDYDVRGFPNPNKSMVVADITNPETGESVTSVIYSGREAEAVL